ncbi:DgyrCDS14901 [Dimorphilus gyrociliatus]|uniref:DgyrCDS14901 n=1 Tax=Dimorphilus gyrociliatus TaxID=2664684 RepID=A0A7I8WFC3_9ANNE|nr:DgyrCDS14901 [Dimorphilus gyrociliatus]
MQFNVLQFDLLTLITDFNISCNGYLTSITYLTTGEDYPFHLGVWEKISGNKYIKKDFRTITKTTSVEQRTVQFEIPMEISTTDYLAFDFLQNTKHGIVSYVGNSSGNVQFYKIITFPQQSLNLPVFMPVTFNPQIYNKYYAFNLQFIPKNVYKKNPVCSNQQNVYGRDLISRNDGGGDFSVLLTEHKFLCRGILRKIEFYRKQTDKSYIGIWRRMSDLAGIKYKLITLITLPDGPINSVQTLELNDTVSVEENDIPFVLNHLSKSNAIANARNSYGDAAAISMNIQKENIQIGQIIDLQLCQHACEKGFRTYSIKFYVDSRKKNISYRYHKDVVTTQAALL